MKNTYLFYVSNFDLENLHSLPRMVHEICKRDKVHKKLVYTMGENNREYIINDFYRVIERKVPLYRLVGEVTGLINKTPIKKFIYFGNPVGLCFFLLNINRVKVLGYFISGEKATLRDYIGLKWNDIRYEFWHYFGPTSHVFVLTLIPDLFLKYIINKNNLACLCVPSIRFKKRLSRIVTGNRVVQVSGGVDYNLLASNDSDKQNGLQKKLNPENKIVLLYLGHIRSSRGMDKTVKIYDDLVKLGKPVKLVLVVNTKHGVGYESAFLDDVNREISRGKDISLIKEHVTDVRPYYHLADFLLLPYRFAPSLPEYPLVVIEGMACGCVICSHSIGAIPELIQDGETGLLSKRSDCDTLVRKIAYLIDNPEIKKRVSQNAIRESKKYNWNMFADKMNKLIFNENKHA